MFAGVVEEKQTMSSISRIVSLGVLLIAAHLLPVVCLSAPADDAPKVDDAATAVRDPSRLVQLVRSAAVAAELKLKPEQSRAIAAMVAEVDYPLFLVRDLSPANKRERLEAIADKVETALATVLTPPQRQRLFEIVLRSHGWEAVLSPQQAKNLGLSDKQVGQIRQILSESAAKTDKSAAPADKRILQLLTPAQKSDLATLTGQPFDLSQVEQVACPAPELRDVADWINTTPVTMESLRGQVVAVHFFAFGCINCVHNQPHYKSWHERYSGKGVTILGLHTPETERERDVANLKADIQARQIAYPIAVDGKASNWAAWSNNMWPSVYLVDKRGYIRYWWYGELNWQGATGEEFMRKRIDELLAEREPSGPRGK